MASAGWIRLHRKILDNPIWPSGRAYTKLEAFLDILLRTNYEPGKARFGGAVFEVKRGELVTSEGKLAERWQWSRGKVRRFLDELRMEQVCLKNGSSKYTTLSLINYEFLQGNDRASSTGDGTADGTADGTQYNKLTNKEKSITPYGVILAAFAKQCPSLPTPEVLTEARKTALRGFWSWCEKDIEMVTGFFDRVEQSDFLAGRTDKPVRFGFDWIIKPANRVKIKEGNYDNRKGAAFRRTEDKGSNLDRFDGFLRGETFDDTGNHEDIEIYCEHIPETG